MSATFLRRPSSLFVSLAFLAGLGMGLFARNGRVLAMPQSDTRAADLAAIEKLHKADVEATLKQDPIYLDQLWSDDCIKVDGPNGPVVGLKAMKEMYAKVKTDYPEFKVLKYTHERHYVGESCYTTLRINVQKGRAASCPTQTGRCLSLERPGDKAEPSFATCLRKAGGCER